MVEAKHMFFILFIFFYIFTICWSYIYTDFKNNPPPQYVFENSRSPQIWPDLWRTSLLKLKEPKSNPEKDTSTKVSASLLGKQ